MATSKTTKTPAARSAKSATAAAKTSRVKTAKAAKPEVKNHASPKGSQSEQGNNTSKKAVGYDKNFLAKQKERLLNLKDTLLDSMNGVARDSLRARAEGSEASAFGMHQADAGSDAYDRDFALSLISQEQDALYEINEALKRIELGSYGVCEISSKLIPKARLEALPFTRYTVECQAELEKNNLHRRVRQPVTSLFGLTDDEGSEDDDDSSADTKD